MSSDIEVWEDATRAAFGDDAPEMLIGMAWDACAREGAFLWSMFGLTWGWVGRGLRVAQQQWDESPASPSLRAQSSPLWTRGTKPSPSTGSPMPRGALATSLPAETPSAAVSEDAHDVDHQRSLPLRLRLLAHLGPPALPLHRRQTTGGVPRCVLERRRVACYTLSRRSSPCPRRSRFASHRFGSTPPWP